MVSKALLLVGLFAVLLVVSKVAAASEGQSGTVKSESEETLRPDQETYEGDNGHGQPYCTYGCCYRGYNGCARCCSYAGEAVQTQPGH